MNNSKASIRVLGEIAYVPLSQGYEAIIDAQDAQAVGLHKWSVSVSKNGSPRALRSVTTNGKRSSEFLERFITQPSEGFKVRHIDGNRLNCRRSNLELVPDQRSSKPDERWIYENKFVRLSKHDIRLLKEFGYGDLSLGITKAAALIKAQPCTPPATLAQ